MLRNLDCLIIGVPINRTAFSLWDTKQKQLYENYVEDKELYDIIGAVYIITP